MNFTPDMAIAPTIGGALIGLASAGMLLLTGRIAGISGITNGILHAKPGDTGWRVAFVMGLILGGIALRVAYPAVFPVHYTIPAPLLGVAGVLVGFGTRLGGGCTSGHGVCGIPRMSPRSILATVTFMFFGMVAVGVVRLAAGGLL